MHNLTNKSIKIENLEPACEGHPRNSEPPWIRNQSKIKKSKVILYFDGKTVKVDDVLRLFVDEDGSSAPLNRRLAIAFFVFLFLFDELILFPFYGVFLPKRAKKENKK